MKLKIDFWLAGDQDMKDAAAFLLSGVETAHEMWPLEQWSRSTVHYFVLKGNGCTEGNT